MIAKIYASTNPLFQLPFKKLKRKLSFHLFQLSQGEKTRKIIHLKNLNELRLNCLNFQVMLFSVERKLLNFPKMALQHRTQCLQLNKVLEAKLRGKKRFRGFK